MKVFKSDGNGGFMIQKGSFALIMTIIALVSCVGTVIAYTVAIRSDVDYLENECRVVDELRDKIVQNQNIIIKNQERILAIQGDIQEIKVDVKELITK